MLTAWFYYSIKKNIFALLLISLAFALGRIQLLCSADARLIIKGYSFLQADITDTAAVIISLNHVHDVVWRLFIV